MQGIPTWGTHSTLHQADFISPTRPLRQKLWFCYFKFLADTMCSRCVEDSIHKCKIYNQCSWHMGRVNYVQDTAKQFTRIPSFVPYFREKWKDLPKATQAEKGGALFSSPCNQELAETASYSLLSPWKQQFYLLTDYISVRCAVWLSPMGSIMAN